MSDPLPLVISNHKANKDNQQLNSWLATVGPAAANFQGTIVVCPSAPFLASAREKIDQNNWNLKLGAQDISSFEQGAYTGETSASQIASICSYTIIGHSERRKNFGEDDKLLEEKVMQAVKNNLKPIFCVQDEDTQIPQGVEIVAYEPIFAIGSGNPDTPENAAAVAAKIKNKGNLTVLYGGSVTDQNVKSFIQPGIVEGVLIGSASLDSQSFLDILKNI